MMAILRICTFAGPCYGWWLTPVVHGCGCIVQQWRLQMHLHGNNRTARLVEGPGRSGERCSGSDGNGRVRQCLPGLETEGVMDAHDGQGADEGNDDDSGWDLFGLGDRRYGGVDR